MCDAGRAWHDEGAVISPLVRAGALVAVAPAAALGCAGDEARAGDFDDPDVPAAALNPDGVPYPTDRIGARARAGGLPGERLPNFSFQGYPGGDRAAGLRTLSLADYFDPEQRRHKLLDIQVAAVWCTICASEAEATVSVADALAREGVVFLQVIVNGRVAAEGPSLDDFHLWLDEHELPYAAAIDVRARRLAGVGVGTVPWDILVDTRTMEILDSSAGAPVDVVDYVRSALRWVEANPPSY